MLGAGFSAAAAGLPLMSGLTDLVRTLEPMNRAAMDLLDRSGLGFEGMLAYLANDQPFLSTAANLRNRARLRRRDFEAREFDLRRTAHGPTRVVAGPARKRLAQTVRVRDQPELRPARRERGRRRPGRRRRSERCVELSLADLAPDARTRYAATWAGGDYGDLFRMAKLHGSIGWAYTGLEGGVGAQIYDLGAPMDLAWERYTKECGDLVPVVVPPALTKAPWLSHAALRRNLARRWSGARCPRP